MKIKNKIMAIILLIITSLSFITTISYGFKIENMIGFSEEQAVERATEIQKMKHAGNSIVRVLSSIGIVVSIVVLIVLGIKYMLGSVEEKAEYKKTLIPYFIGASLVFAASAIAQLIYTLAINEQV